MDWRSFATKAGRHEVTLEMISNSAVQAPRESRSNILPG